MTAAVDDLLDEAEQALKPTFSDDVVDYLAQFDERLLSCAEGRRLLTRLSPKLFALIYLTHHLYGPETGNVISFSEFHEAMFDEARRWVGLPTKPAADRAAVIAPRGAGKSTMAFLILPMWGAAHQHISFVAAFADAAHQAELHLQTFKRELETNELLRNDFPELCEPMRRPRGMAVADNSGMMYTKSHFVFMARGIDTSSLGMKVDKRRPDLLLFDDVEPPEANYSLYQKEQRLSNLQDAAFPLNIYARVLMVGTTTMYGSIMHDVVKQATDPDGTPDWVSDEKIRTLYFPAIVINPDGTERSLWPEKWSLEYLRSIRKSRSFAKNYMNQPTSSDGGYWTKDDFNYDVPQACTRWLLSIDPAVTSKTTSDFAGLAIVGYDPNVQRCAVKYAAGVKLSPKLLRQHVLMLLEQYPEVKGILIESNQGGDWLKEGLSPMPVQIASHTVSENKLVRAAKVLEHYQMNRVAHVGQLPAFEDQALAFPNVAHDDIVDAVVNGVNYFLKNVKKRPARATVTSYA